MNGAFSRACGCAVFIIAAMFVAVNVNAGDDESAGPRVMQMDVVNLIAGKETPGLPEFTVAHGKFIYHFADGANLAEFKAHPEKYEIQFGGACARMGPLSGDGRTDIFAVHENHLYLFASAGCRKTFLSMPDKFLDPPEAPPAVIEENAKRGRELIDRAVEAIGGAARLDVITTYRERTSRTETIGKDADKKTVEASSTTTLRFADGVRQDEQWDEFKWCYVALSKEGWSADKTGTTLLDRQQCESLFRDGRRNVLTILRARNKPGYVVAAAGAGKIKPPDGDEITVDLVTVAFDGTVAILGIDQSTGRIMSTTYRGRGPGLFFGEVRKVFSDFRPVGVLTLPWCVTVRFDGDEAMTATTRFAELKIDDPADANRFQRETAAQ